MLKPRKGLTARKEIKQDKFVTFYFQAQELLGQYKNWIGLAVLGIVSILALILYIRNSTLASEELAASKLAEAKTHYSSGNHAAASSLLGPLVTEHGGTHSGTVGIIFLAKSFLAQEQYDEAMVYFNKYLDKFGDDEVLTLAARIGIASCHDQQKNYEQAAQSYESIASDKNFKAADMLLDAARCYELAGQIAEAKRVLNRVVADFPTTVAASTAKISLAELKD